MKLFKKIMATGFVAVSVMLSASMLCTESVSAKDKDGDYVIVLDPGHGGNDPGKEGVTGVKEDQANYAIAMAIKEELSSYTGVKVYVTRPENSWMSNTGRAMVAVSLDADFLISLHNNSGSDSSRGAIVFTSLLPLYSEVTADLGNDILTHLEELGLSNQGIQTRPSTEYAGEDYYTIMAESMRAGTPAVLVEHCFLSSAEDSAFLADSNGNLDFEKIAKIGMADTLGIVDYFGLEKRTATADSANTIELIKGQSAVVEPAVKGSGAPSWVSSNKEVVSVTDDGVAVAVGTGEAKVMYSYADGTNGYVTVNVPKVTALSLVGGINPTFYKTESDFAALDTSSIFANIVYSDGSVACVKPEKGSVPQTPEKGINDIEIKYNDMTGLLRVFYTPEGYVPDEVTSMASEPETEKQTAEETTEFQMPELQTKGDGSDGSDKSNTDVNKEDGQITISFSVQTIIKVLIAIIVVIIFGTIIYIAENGVKNRRRKNKRRRRY